MNEAAAREATLLQAFESARPSSPHWNDEDRIWADRVALEDADAAIGADAPDDAFVAHRTRHAMQRLLPRDGASRLAVAGPARIGRWVAAAAVLGLAFGLVADSIGASHRINLLAPPLWGVLAWNGVVYLLLLATGLFAMLRRGPRPAGPLVRGVRSLLRSGSQVSRSGSRTLRNDSQALPAGVHAGANDVNGPSGPRGIAALFFKSWAERSAPLALLRAEAVLHVGAAALALGLIAGFYARGLVLDYRAVWESTFLSARGAHALVTAVLAPAAALSGIVLPDVEAFATLRTVQGGLTVGMPAAAWIHLFGLTLLLFVVLPRGLLAAWCAIGARRRSRRFPLPLADPYFQRLLRLRSGEPAAVDAWPYAVTPQPDAISGLRGIVAEALGPRAALRIAPTTPFGSEEEASFDVPVDTRHAIAWFDLSATPEAENQGRFVELLEAALPAGADVSVVVDETGFGRRFAATPQRIAQRRDAWHRFAEALGKAPVFADLAQPDLEAAAAAWQAAMSTSATASSSVRTRPLTERPLTPA